VLQRLYGLGIKPDWWKLESQPSDEAWHAVETAVRTGDPYCRGVVLLGLDAPEDTLLASFARASRHGVVKGFAVGRTIFGRTAERWLAGTISDEAAVSEMAAGFHRLSEAWDFAVAADRREPQQSDGAYMHASCGTGGRP
jgi:5-dehydro-2-deoxygluconokinase